MKTFEKSRPCHLTSTFVCNEYDISDSHLSFNLRKITMAKVKKNPQLDTVCDGCKHNSCIAKDSKKYLYTKNNYA